MPRRNRTLPVPLSPLPFVETLHAAYPIEKPTRPRRTPKPQSEAAPEPTDFGRRLREALDGSALDLDHDDEEIAA